jgi:hypothetical protein
MNYQRPATWLISLTKLQCLPGVPSLEVKRLGREADHSPSPNTDVKSEWHCNSTHTPSCRAEKQLQIYLAYIWQRECAFITALFSTGKQEIRCSTVRFCYRCAAFRSCHWTSWHSVRLSRRARWDDKRKTLYIGNLVLLRNRRLEDKSPATCLGWGTQKCTMTVMTKPQKTSTWMTVQEMEGKYEYIF